MFAYEISCRNCGWRTLAGLDDAVARLRLIGLLRREPEPAEELVATLLVEAAPRMTCAVCKEKSLRATPAEDVEADDWQAAVLCELCRMPISPDRLEAIPGAKRCAVCQGKAESGELEQVEPEYCPRCGAIVELRVSRGSGMSRFKRFCTGSPPCRL